MPKAPRQHYGPRINKPLCDTYLGQPTRDNPLHSTYLDNSLPSPMQSLYQGKATPLCLPNSLPVRSILYSINMALELRFIKYLAQSTAATSSYIQHRKLSSPPRLVWILTRHEQYTSLRSCILYFVMRKCLLVYNSTRKLYLP